MANHGPRQKHYDAAMLKGFVDQLLAEIEIHELARAGHLTEKLTAQILPGIPLARTWGTTLLPYEYLVKGAEQSDAEYKIAKGLHSDHVKTGHDLLKGGLMVLESALEDICAGIEEQHGEPRLKIERVDGGEFAGMHRDATEKLRATS
jgi:hypothetical protein